MFARRRIKYTLMPVREYHNVQYKSYTDLEADTKLADRTAALSAQPAPPPPTSSTPPVPPPIAKTPSRGKASSPAPSEASASTDALTRLRNDLATTQKARAGLQTQVSELTNTLKELELRQKSSSSQIAQLIQQKTALERRLKDREEELRGKQKLVEDAQDEMVAQGLQLNIAEEKAERLKKENKDLVERWMKRMGEEADRVNRESSWE
jgi:DNA repair exonuclease SbcCD ATPase subunit